MFFEWGFHKEMTSAEIVTVNMKKKITKEGGKSFDRDQTTGLLPGTFLLTRSVFY